MDFSSDSPIYLQIAQDVRTRITDGDLGPGDQLMSTTQYATTYRINPATANKAFAALVQEGLVEKRRGIGMFVTEDAPEILRASGRSRYLDDVLGPAIRRGLSLGLAPSAIRDHVDSILEDS
ncbi:GntR family transcriptional regulator [Brachybacterium sp. JHP9]|uniref:GntR family transcriptional regulator n=1 Tax=Brachybacterium equifaecis TaxID=2910770 RepID=A0ABT0QXD6_9MICO|nr:GntR family transcriptional regulator [Brachybacterium equifaecis]MCL6422316.1 GntR family transcriptional regulator [Brachybacterium equifaecis]